MKFNRLNLMISIFSIMLQTASLVLTVLSLVVYPLTTLSHTSGEFNHTASSCLDCPSPFTGTTYSCLSSIACKSDNADLCDKGDRLDNAQWPLLLSEILSMVLVLLSLERLLALACDKYIGKLFAIPVLGIAQTSTKLIGSFLFVILGQIEMWDCSSLCLSKGGMLLGLNLILSTVYSILACFICKLYHSKQPVMIEGVRRMNVKILLMLLVYLLFWVLSLCYDWISFKTSEYHSGSLLKYNDLEGYDPVEYSCAAAIVCPQNMKRECEALTNLKHASKFYFEFSIIGTALLFLWIEHAIFLANKQVFGFSGLLGVTSWTCFGLSVCGLIGWIVHSEIKFQGCEIEKTDESISFCAESGLIFGLISIVILFLTLIFYTCMWAQLKQHKRVEIVTETMPKSENTKTPRLFTVVDSKPSTFEIDQNYKTNELDQTDYSTIIPGSPSIQK